MLIETANWGTIEIDDRNIYHFAKGIPGFEQEREFILIDEDEGMFTYLQSVTSKELAFLLADPFLFYPDYGFELPDSEEEELELDSELLVRCILTLKEPLDLSTINLLAPIVMNPVARLGKQIVLHQTAYQTRHPLWADRPGPAKASRKAVK